jgi:hypothetical protein
MTKRVREDDGELEGWVDGVAMVLDHVHPTDVRLEVMRRLRGRLLGLMKEEKARQPERAMTGASIDTADGSAARSLCEDGVPSATPDMGRQHDELATDDDNA